jgi:plasmid stability protein
MANGSLRLRRAAAAADRLKFTAHRDIIMISEEPVMVDILVRNVDDDIAAQLKKKAKTAGKSVNDIAREALRAAARPNKQEVWAELDRIRARIGARAGGELPDSTPGIREDRDNDEPYR